MEGSELQGYTRGSNPCIDRCLDNFDACLARGTDFNQCLAERSFCLANCAQQEQPQQPPPTDQPCDQGCPTCAEELQMSSPCTESLGHAGSHACANGHTW